MRNAGRFKTQAELPQTSMLNACERTSARELEYSPVAPRKPESGAGGPSRSESSTGAKNPAQEAQQKCHGSLKGQNSNEPRKKMQSGGGS